MAGSNKLADWARKSKITWQGVLAGALALLVIYLIIGLIKAIFFFAWGGYGKGWSRGHGHFGGHHRRWDGWDRRGGWGWMQGPGGCIAGGLICDTDSDGKLSRQELDEAFDEIYLQFDTDGDGSIDGDEIRRGFRGNFDPSRKFRDKQN